MKKIFTVLVLVFLASTGFTQNARVIDSLKAELSSIDFGHTADSLLLQCCELANKEGNDIDIAFCLKTQAQHKFNCHEIDAASIDINAAISAYQKLQNNDGLVKSLLVKAQIFDNTSKPDSAKYYYDIVLNKAKSPDNIFEIRYRYGVYHLNKDNLKEATKHLEVAFETATELNDDKKVARVLYRLGNISISMKEYEKAYNKLTESLEKLETSDASKMDIANNLFLLGNYFLFQKDKKEAIKYYKRALILYQKTNSNLSIGYTLSGIGTCYSHLKEYDKANQYLDSAIIVQTKIDAKKYLANTYNRKAILNFYINEIPLAIEFTEKSLALNKELKRDKNIYAGYFNLAFLCDTIGKSKLAYKHMLKAFYYKDTVLKNDYFEKLATIETKYETHQKENEILKLTNENIRKQTAITQARFTSFGIFAALLLVISFGYFYWHKRKQQHKLALLQNTVETGEHEKSRIGKELHDGIASTLMTLVHDSEEAQIHFSHKLLQTYNEVRNLSHQLDNRPVHGELFLERIMDVIPENKNNRDFDFQISPRHLQLNEPHSTHVFRIMQELIANNLKHSKATKTNIQLNLENETLTLSYTDNGIGISHFRKGNGYKNMEDRALLMQGKMNIDTQTGFSAIFTIPYTL